MALGLMSFCLVTMLGLVPVGLKQERLSSERFRSFEALSAVVADVAVDASPANRSIPPTTPRYRISLPPSTASAPGSGTFYMDDRFDFMTTGTGAAFKIWYEVTPPGNRHGSYSIRLCVANAASALNNVAISSLANRDFVETFTAKSAF